MKIVVIIAFFLIAIYILRNCDVSKSTGVLIVVLGALIYMMAHPGKEEFEEQALALDPDLISLIGLQKPSLYECTSAVGEPIIDRIV
jgi:hypothetical protein